MVYLEAGADRAVVDWMRHAATSPGHCFVVSARVERLKAKGSQAQAIYKALAKRGAEARVAHFSPHDLRKTVASELIDASGNLSHQWYAHYFTAIGHHEEAIREARLACELDPTSPNKRSILGYVRYFARQYNQAIEDAERAHELDGRLRPMYSSRAYLELGRYTEAVDYHLQANAMAGEKQEKLDELRRGFQTEGIRGFWKKQIEQFKEAARPEGETNRYFAMIYSLLGEKNKSLLYLEKMFQERNGFLIYLKVDPAYDNLRGDPRFTVLLRRVRLA